VGVDVLRVQNENNVCSAPPFLNGPQFRPPAEACLIPGAGARRPGRAPGRELAARGVIAAAGGYWRVRIPEISLTRRSATATGSTVIGCVQSNVQNIRIEEAKRLLESERAFFPKQ
jgi:hypothetical protein